MMPMTPYDACVAYLNAQCNRRDRECAGREVLAHPCPYAEERCPDFLFADGSGFDVASALACAEAFKTFPCDQLNRGFYPDCVMTPGSRMLGEPCISSHQCASTACGKSDDAAHPSCGACVPIGKQGDPCADGSFGCPNGYECIAEGCQPQVAFNLPDGALCERYAQCAGDDFCFIAPDGMPRCQLPRKLNEDCTGNALCEAGTTCFNNHCVMTTPEYAALGESCFARPCVPEAWCHSLSSMAAQCIARAAPGAACVVDNHVSDPRGNCQDPALDCYCSGDACTPHCLMPLAKGATCGDAASYCAFGTTCQGGTCVGATSQGLFEDACVK
jgi:hypothetical protein